MHNGVGEFGLRPFPIHDFGGGVTDNYLAGSPRQARRMKNLTLERVQSAEGGFYGQPKTRFGSQIVSTTVHLPAYLTANPRVNSIFSFEDQIFELSGRNLYYNSGTYATLTGATGNQALPAGTTASYNSWDTANHHMLITNDAMTQKVQKIFKKSGTWAVQTAGLPALATSPTVTPVAGAGNYLYRFCYFYTYTIGSEVFEIFGATTEVSCLLAAAPNVSTVAITAIPVIANGTTDNYATTVITCKVYRTESNGTSFYYVGQVTNGTTTYNDTMSDATLVANNIQLYTEGGVLDNDTPPISKYVIIANGIAYYLHIKDGSETFPNRFRQSKKDQYDCVPASFEEFLDDDITGGGVIDRYPIIFCKTKIYRIEGAYDELGRGYVEKKIISNTVGCLGHSSIVRTREGLFFAGTDGFYFTNGFEVKKLSQHLNTTYRAMTDTTAKQLRMCGAFDERKNMVWWACQLDSASSDNDGCFVLDLNWGLSEESTFNTHDGDASFAPTSIMFISGNMYRSDRRGYLLKHDSSYTTDPKIDTTANPANWVTQTIKFDYWSCALNFGLNAVRKWVPKVVITARNVSNVSVDMIGYNDDSGAEKPLKEVRMQLNVTWGESRQVWGDANAVWNWDKLVAEVRRFPAGGLRCNFKQLRIKNSKTTIENSDTLGLATVDLSHTATLETSANVWPSECIDYYITFAADGYLREYLITGRTNTILTFADAGNNAPNATGQKWLLRGYARGDLLHLLALEFWHSPLTDTQKSFDKSNTGGNA